MCQRCYDALQKHYPHLSDEDKINILWSATAYPMAEAETIERQIAEVRAATDGTLFAALAYADKQMQAAMDGGSRVRAEEGR
jgi:hypothetical protein